MITHKVSKNPYMELRPQETVMHSVIKPALNVHILNTSAIRSHVR